MQTYHHASQPPILPVRDQIDISLQQAIQQLERFDRDPDDGATLAACVEPLHQVHGSLTMLDLPAACALVTEMQRLVTAMGDPRRGTHPCCGEILITAALLLPRYLQQVHELRRETPALLVPTINLLRLMRRAALIPEHRFVHHRIPSAYQRDSGHPIAADCILPTQLPRLRQRYQASLVQVIGERAVATHLDRMAQAVQGLQALCGRQPFNELWYLTLGLLDALRHGGLRLDTSVKHMLGQVDRQIYRLSRRGPAQLAQTVDPRLREALLYYLAKTRATSKRLRQLKARYHLAGLVENEAHLEQARQRLQAPDRAALQAVAGQLQQELEVTKTYLLHREDPHTDRQPDTRSVVQSLQQIALTLEVIELHRAAEQCRDMGRHIRAASEDHTRPDIETLAASLMCVENQLQQLALGETAARTGDSGIPLSGAAEQAMVEATDTLARIQQALDSYLDPYGEAYANPGELAAVAELAGQVAGALTLLQLPALAATVQALSHYILQQSQRQLPPTGHALESFTDAFVAVEWALEVYPHHGRQDPRALEIARQSLRALVRDPETYATLH